MPELGSQPLFVGRNLDDFECWAVFWSMGSINVCELVETVANLLGKDLSGEGSLQTDQINGWAVARIRGKLTSRVRFLTPLTSPGASEDPGSSNVQSMPTTCS